MGLLGVVAALAMRKTEGIVFLILHQIFWANAASDYILSVKQTMSSAILVVLQIPNRHVDRSLTEKQRTVTASDASSNLVGPPKYCSGEQTGRAISPAPSENLTRGRGRKAYALHCR